MGLRLSIAAALRGAGWRRCAGLRAAGCCPPAAALRGGCAGVARGLRAAGSGRSSRQAAAACLQRAAGRALINALVNGKRCVARVRDPRPRLRALHARLSPPLPRLLGGGKGGDLAEGPTCGCGGSAMGRCVSLTGSCVGRNLPRYFNLERREICLRGGVVLSFPPSPHR